MIVPKIKKSVPKKYHFVIIYSPLNVIPKLYDFLGTQTTKKMCYTDESKYIQFWNDMRVSEWWQNFHFFGELSLKANYQIEFMPLLKIGILLN